MEPEILKLAEEIVTGIIKLKDPYEKISIVLKIVPIESFDESFRFFSNEDQKKIIDAIELAPKVDSIETKMVVNEFIEKNDLLRFLKTTTLHDDEILQAFQKYAGKNPRKISQMLSKTWLES